ncbi:MAG: hypothetical protein QG579_562, partial [Patescibacteria group bacterium]|nr:hypothetical protein [Patescibacteria group bacterium]
SIIALKKTIFPPNILNNGIAGKKVIDHTIIPEINRFSKKFDLIIFLNFGGESEIRTRGAG